MSTKENARKSQQFSLDLPSSLILSQRFSTFSSSSSVFSSLMLSLYYAVLFLFRHCLSSLPYKQRQKRQLAKKMNRPKRWRALKREGDIKAHAQQGAIRGNRWIKLGLKKHEEIMWVDNRERKHNRKREEYRKVKIASGREVGQKGNERVSLLCMFVHVCLCV